MKEMKRIFKKLFKRQKIILHNKLILKIFNRMTKFLKLIIQRGKLQID